MRTALFLSLVLSSVAVACSSAEPNEVSNDSGSTPSLCAEDTSCSCGGTTCAGDEFCHIGTSTAAGPQYSCRKFIRGANCADTPCAEDRLCAPMSINGVAGVGCRLRPALGERCDLPHDVDENPCGPGEFCGSAPGMTASICQKAASAGASCATFSKFACPSGETCRAVVFPDFKCAPAAKVGQSCLNSTDCDLGLYCTKDETCAVRKGVGGTCDPLRGGALGGECARYLSCEDGTCREGN